MNAGELAVSLAGLLLAHCAGGRGQGLRLDVLPDGTLVFSTDAASPWPGGPPGEPPGGPPGEPPGGPPGEPPGGPPGEPPGGPPVADQADASPLARVAWLLQDAGGERRSSTGAGLPCEPLRPGEATRLTVRAQDGRGTAALQSDGVLAALRALAAEHPAVRFRIALAAELMSRRREG